MPGSPMPDGHLGRVEALALAELEDLFGDDLRRRLARAETLIVGRLGFHLANDAPVTRDHQGERLGAADVNADRDVTHGIDVPLET